MSKIKRERAKKGMRWLEDQIKFIFETLPRYRELENSNSLIRLIWKLHGEDVKAGSILTTARTVRRKYPELDTRKNQEERANSETAWKEYAREGNQYIIT